MEDDDEKQPLLCPACQRRFPLKGVAPRLTPLQRGLLIMIEAAPGGVTCAELYRLLPFAKRRYCALTVHISRLRKALNPLGLDIDIKKTQHRQSDQTRYKLVRWGDCDAHLERGSPSAEPVLCDACQKRFPLNRAIPILRPLQRSILIRIEASPGGATCADLYPFLPVAKRRGHALKVHISRLRKFLNPLGIEIEMNKTEYKQSDQARYQLVRFSQRNAYSQRNAHVDQRSGRAETAEGHGGEWEVFDDD